MVASKIRLTYFATQGLAEPIRLILADSGIEHEDNRIPGIEVFRETYKPNRDLCIFGKVPVLEYGDVVIIESSAILRFLGAELGYPSSNLETALSEGLVSSLKDMIGRAKNASFQDDKIDSTLLKKWFEEALPKDLDAYEAWTTKWNPEGKGYFFGTDEPTYGEFYFLDLFYFYTSIYSLVLEKHPKLKALFTKLLNRENVQKYLKAGKRAERRGGLDIPKIL